MPGVDVCQVLGLLGVLLCNMPCPAWKDTHTSELGLSKFSVKFLTGELNLAALSMKRLRPVEARLGWQLVLLLMMARVL